MTILTELARLYDRLAAEGKAPPRGFSMEKIGGEVVLGDAGRVLAVRDLRTADERGKLQPRVMAVPDGGTRTSGIKPNTLWDKTAYALGVTTKRGADKKPLLDDQGRPTPETEGRVVQEHAAFIAHHEELLEGTEDEGLQALLGFVHSWRAEMFAERGFDPALLDQNLVFRLDGDFREDGTPRRIHERPAARKLVTGGEDRERGFCLVTGQAAPIARLHPAIKFSDPNAQSSGAYLVSFNIGSKKTVGASSSHGKEQGENAPVSEEAAFAYGAALNALLAKGSGRSLRIGYATVAFWAEVAESARAATIEEMMAGVLAPDEKGETGKLAALMQDIANGRASEPGLDPATRVFILGLAPNAARLSVRFWRPGTLGDFARNITRFWEDLAQEPSAWIGPPAAWSLLYETAIRAGGKPKADTIPPRLGGDLMRAVLTGGPYPRTLLSSVITRIRADHDVNPRRVAILAAVLRRNFKEKIPMSLDRENPDPAYRLGRLFAVLEGIQQAALPGLNATIRDRYFAAAMATPARVFPLLVRNAMHHLSNLKKGDAGGLAHWFEAEMGEIWSALEPSQPRSLNLEAQGRFVAGYYHQRWAKKDDTDAPKMTDPEGADK